MTAFTELFEQLDPDDNVRGKQFERICKWYLEHDPVYAGQLTRVWLWKDWPGRWYPKKEAGIDLVAEHRDGTLWAIQSKAYDPAYSVTKEGMNSFLSESNRPQFSYRLLIATTDKLGPTATNTMKGQAIPVGHLGRTDLDAVEIDWPASPSDLRARRQPPKEPKGHWAYQGEAMKKVVKGFQQADRGKLIMACGTGKTLTTLFIREKLAAERTLVLMPSLQLMKQTIGEWRRNKKVYFDFLPVCSDETVSKDDDDMPVSSTSDLGFPVTTDPEEIATFLRQRSGPRVVFATYQSSSAIAKAFKLGQVPAFDLAIADEAHRCAGPHSSEFATILDNEKIKARRRLFMTATPRIYSARVLTTAKEEGFEFASMDDEEIFGKVFHRLTFREAIERKLLTDYQVAIIGVDNATYRDWAEKGWFITIDGKEVRDARAVAGQIGLAKAMRAKAMGGYDLRRVITFHRLRKRAKEFAASLPEVIDWMPARQRPKGHLWTDYVDGTMPADDRQRRLQSLSGVGEGERGLISNARCLTEGIDVPTLDGVAFIDPKRSEIDIAQAVGRAIRLADGKTIGTIVIPVFIDTDEPDPDVILDDSAFKPVWDVLLALRAHDEDLAQQLDDLRRMLGRLVRGNSRGSLRLPPKIKVDIPDVGGVEFARAFDVRIIKQTTASWEEWFGMLEEYVAENHDADVEKTYTVDVNGRKYNLGSWAGTQRQAYAKGDLDPDRINRLEALGFKWNTKEAQWEKNFREFEDYIQRNGHAPSQSCALGVWANSQRQYYGKGDLSPDRIRRLEEIGFEWRVKDARWDEAFRQVQEFAALHGYFPGRGDPGGDWVNNQRALYRKGALSLSPERIRRLKELDGWVWNVSDAEWEKMYSQVVEFIKRNGRLPTLAPSDGDVGSWVANQRVAYRRDRLDSDRVERLKKLDGWAWHVDDAKWGKMYGQVADFIKHNGRLPRMPFESESERELYRWVFKQRNLYGNLDPARVERLKKLSGWVWEAHDAKWEKRYSEVADFIKHNGRLPVQSEGELGKWVSHQRDFYRKGTLSTDRIERLKSLGDIWEWNPPRGAASHRTTKVRADKSAKVERAGRSQ
jgi:superfamily II DNA or RNA helicase